MRKRRGTQILILVLPIIAVNIFLFLAPLGYTVLTSFYYHPPGAIMEPILTTENYTKFLFDSYYWRVVGTTLLIGAVTTSVTLLIAYPLAYQLSRNPRLKAAQLVILISPLMINAVIRTYGWKVLLSDVGVVNQMLISTGLIQEPIRFVNSMTGVFIALAHVLLPYMVLSISSVLEGIDESVVEAARMLGARKLAVFLKITLPLSLPGVIAGSIFVFVSSAGSFLVPTLMGGGRVRTIPTLMYQYMSHLLNWPFGSVLAFIMTSLTVLVVALVGGLALRRARSAEVGER